MVNAYLDRGDMYVLFSDGLKAICVVTDEGDGVCELKNIATVPAYQRKGYGRQLVNFITGKYADKFSVMLVGTGDISEVLTFYTSCGFSESHRVKNFFIENYDHPIYENGKQLVDMVYLSKKLLKSAGNVEKGVA